jgi:hypothetical protein
MTNQRTPFKIGTHFTQGRHHRYDLREWVRSEFPFVESSLGYAPNELLILEERAPEIVEACRQIEEIDTRAGSNYVGYYAPCWTQIRGAVKKRDFQELGEALDFLLCSIDVE